MRQSPRLTQLRRLATIGLAVSAVACSSATDSARPLEQRLTDFQTDSASYALASDGRWYSGTIAVTYTNRTSDTTSFVNCGGGTDVGLQKMMDGEWTTVWSPVLLACASPPIVVAPGAQHRIVVFVAAGYPGTNTAPQFSTHRISGQYRALWNGMIAGGQAGIAEASTPPIEHRVSNEFTITAPDP